MILFLVEKKGYLPIVVEAKDRNKVRAWAKGFFNLDYSRGGYPKITTLDERSEQFIQIEGE
jgi:hypothetical protein